MLNFGHFVCFFTLVSTAFLSSINLEELSNNINQRHGLDTKEKTLVLAHVLFRHGNRTTEGEQESYPKDPYYHEEYFPIGLGQLTNEGKRKEYQIGKALRERYADFLGKPYYPDIVEAQSTDYNRTKVSLELVLAGLFPPSTSEESWENNFPWQPVPYNYLPKYEDKILMGILCPHYLKLYHQVHVSAEMQREYNEYKEVFEYISNHSGLNIDGFFDVYNLYFVFAPEQEWGFKLPPWTKKVWPKTVTDLAIKQYDVFMKTPDMRRMATGYLLKKIIQDTKNKITSTKVHGKKLHLYSAHEDNIARLLMALDVFQRHVPTYGSYVIIEVHFINNVYGVKIFYDSQDGNGPQLLKMPKCDSFCPFDKFVELLQEYIPSDSLCRM